MHANGIFELRRYRLRPGQREALIGLFEREFVETQEEAGMTLHGFYRDEADPDAFVWMRSFPDMARRATALASFYGGEVWKRWAADANAAMLNSDNVLLLKPANGTAPLSGRYGPGGVVTIATCALAPGREEEFAETWARDVQPLVEGAGARIDGAFVTEHGLNTFPRLPVREGHSVFVWISAFPDRAAFDAHAATLARLPRWTGFAFPWLDAQLWRPLETAVLTSTARSRHGW